MGKIAYYFGRIFKADYKGMFDTINKVSKRSHKLKIVIFFDMIISSIRYGAGYTDYFLFYFEDLNHSQKRTYVTRVVNNGYYKAMNDSRYYDVFRDKNKFNERFKEYINRAFLVLKENKFEQFLEFTKKTPVFMAKVIEGTGGHGVAKITVDKKTNLKELFEKLLKNKQFLLEEYVIQHEVMNKLCKASVNTLRIVTIRKNNKVHIMLRVIRIGNGIYEVDNFHKGGMFTIFNEDGIITKPAVDREGIVHDSHPLTKTKFIGFKIPYYKEAIDLCIKASGEIPEVGMVGWDVAITPKGPVIIECNELPGYDLYQSKVHLDENRHGLKPLFDKVIFDEE